MQAAPAGPGLQRQGDSDGGLAVASGIVSDLQRQGNSAGGLSVASSIGAGLQRQGDSFGEASVGSGFAGALQRQHDSSGAQSHASIPDSLPSLPSTPCRQAPVNVSVERFLRLKAKGDGAMAMHVTSGGIEMARLSMNSDSTAALSEGGPFFGSATPSCSSPSAAERYERNVPRSFSSALSVPSSAASFVTGALSSAVSATGTPSSLLEARGDAATRAPGSMRLALQASSVVVPRVSDPASGPLRNARSMSSGAAAAQGWCGDGAAALPTGDCGDSSPCVSKGQHEDSTHGGGADAALPQGCLTTSAPPISPFVASRQTRQRRMLPVSPFSDQA